MDLLVHNRWTFLTYAKVGAGPTLSGANLTDMKLIVDTRSYQSYVFGKECTSCINNNRYERHPNANFTPGLPAKHIRDIVLTQGYTTNDTLCIRDNEGVGQVNFPCAPNRTLAVITD